MRRIEQRRYKQGDCDVACVAMIAHMSYAKVHLAFEELGLIKNGQYFTYHKDLIKVLHLLGLNVERHIFRSWDEVQAPAIVKVNVRAGNFWHWVVLSESRILLDPKPGAPSAITDFRGRKGHGHYLRFFNKQNKFDHKA